MEEKNINLNATSQRILPKLQMASKLSVLAHGQVTQLMGKSLTTLSIARTRNSAALFEIIRTNNLNTAT